MKLFSHLSIIRGIGYLLVFTLCVNCKKDYNSTNPSQPPPESILKPDGYTLAAPGLNPSQTGTATLFNYNLEGSLVTNYSKNSKANIKALKAPPEPWNIHSTFDMSGIWYNECAGEDMEVTASMVFLMTGLISNNRLVSVWNIRIFGKGVGLTSGTEYIIRENNNSTYNESFVNGLITFPLSDKWRFISKGNTTNLYGEFSWNLVYNAKGEEVVNTFDFHIDCK